MYYAQGIHLAMYDEPLFQDWIEAWSYGPVIPNLYHKYKQFGAEGIHANPKFDSSSIDQHTLDFLDEIYKVFGQFSAIRLMEIAHKDKCWKDAGIGNEITQDAMRVCLKKYIKK